MPLVTEFESVLADVPKDLLPGKGLITEVLDLERRASGGRSREVVVDGPSVPQRLREIIQLAGKHLSDADQVRVNLIHRRGTSYPYRYRVGWDTETRHDIASLSLLPLLHRGFSFGKNEPVFEGIDIKSYNRRNSVVVSWAAADNPTQIQREMAERSKLLMQLGMHSKDIGSQLYKLESVRDLASVFLPAK